MAQEKATTLSSGGFAQLLGKAGGQASNGGRPSSSVREPFEWRRLPTTDGIDYGETIVRVPDDYEQPSSIVMALLFEPAPEGIYDIEWVVGAHARVTRGETIARGYRITDGVCFTQTAPFDLKIIEPLVKRNRRAVAGDALVKFQVTGLSLDTKPVEHLIRRSQMELFQAVNAAFKGVMGALGEGGQIAKEVIPLACQLHPEKGLQELMVEIRAALEGAGLQEGDVVVISEKLFAIAQGRLFPLSLLYAQDPKMTDREGRRDMLPAIAEHVPDIEETDLLLADALPDWPDEPMATAGVRDPNGIAYEISQTIKEASGVRCDVVISDTDTGAEIRETVIGCPTVGATPIGATGGLVLYECMRVAMAAEFARGSSRGIPIVICRPHERHATRTGVAKHRYPGMLDATRERLVGFA
jgi:F420-0:gamma-glutamyl ligase